MITTESIEELRKIDAFSGLSDHQLTWFLERSEARSYAAGEVVTQAGSPAEHLIVLLTGVVQGSMRENGAETYVFTVEAPAVTSLLPFSRMKILPATIRTLQPSRALFFHKDHFPAMYTELPEAIPKLVAILTDRVREVEKAITQNDKLASLGKLSAGLAHELNNPAAAARQASLAARRAFEQFTEASDGFLTLRPTEAFLHEVCELEVTAADGIRNPPPLDSLTRSDREQAIGDYLQDVGVEDAWEVASAFVDAGFLAEDLQKRTEHWVPDCRAFALQRVAAAIHMEQVLAQMFTATSRISDLVKAIKDYSYMDRSALVEIDLHHSLDTTLKMFSFRLKHGVKVETDYDPALPKICANGGQLNQVWTNLIDNAIDAMMARKDPANPPLLKVRTCREADIALVEITDNGTGIPDHIATKVFDPFFTTKGQGSGTGLGLDTVYRIVHQHQGHVEFDSKPGCTVFSVRLPLHPQK